MFAGRAAAYAGPVSSTSSSRLGRTRGGVERVAEKATDVAGLFEGVAGVVGDALPVNGWCGHTLDPSTAMVTGGVAHEGYRADLVPRLLEIEYVVGDVNPFDQLLHRPSPAGVLHDATDGEPTRSLRYTDVMVPSGIEHELRVVFRHQQRPWGALVLLRDPAGPAFTARERDAVAGLGPTLALSLKRMLLRGFVDAGGVPEHAGLLMIGADGGVESATTEAEHWLDDLRDHEGAVPLPVRALASSAGDAEGRAVRARARGRSGTWLTLTAWRLGDRVAVSMESAAPHDLTALALEAYSLSPREREIVELVLLGWSTAEIGTRLHLSPYTVQDHLKTVFDKTGVRSRRELAADLFFRHYLPRIERGARLNADGWFADD